MHSQYKGLAKARIIMNDYEVDKDSLIQLVVFIELANNWHIYWKNPGESGIPTSIDWITQDGFQFIEEYWPIPKEFEYEGVVSYGYENQALFIIDIILPRIINSSMLNISAKIKSLLCKDICVPFDTTVNFSIDMHKNYSADESVTGIFSQTRKSLPIKSDNKGFLAEVISDNIYFCIDRSTEYYFLDTLNFISYENGLYKNSLNQTMVRDEDYLKIILEPDPFRLQPPKELYGLLVYNLNGDESVSRKALEIKIPISQ